MQRGQAPGVVNCRDKDTEPTVALKKNQTRQQSVFTTIFSLICQRVIFIVFIRFYGQISKISALLEGETAFVNPVIISAALEKQRDEDHNV